jgi:hypothetical protein
MSGVVSTRAIKLVSRQSIDAKLGPVPQAVGQAGSPVQSGSAQSVASSPSSSTPLPHCSEGRVVEVVPMVVVVELDEAGAVAVVVLVDAAVDEVVAPSDVVVVLAMVVVEAIELVVDSVVVVDSTVVVVDSVVVVVGASVDVVVDSIVVVVGASEVDVVGASVVDVVGASVLDVVGSSVDDVVGSSVVVVVDSVVDVVGSSVEVVGSSVVDVVVSVVEVVDSSVDVVVSSTPARATVATRQRPSRSGTSRSDVRAIGARSYPSLPRPTSKATCRTAGDGPPDCPLVAADACADAAPNRRHRDHGRLDVSTSSATRTGTPPPGLTTTSLYLPPPHASFAAALTTT